jgi:hypothetical protein
MNPKRRLLTFGLVLALGLSACGQPSGGDQAGQAQQQFLSERSGTPGPTGEPAGTAAQDLPVMGIVDSVEGDKLIVKNPFDDTSTTVQLAADTQVKKQAPGRPSDIKAGDPVTATGTRQGDQFEPESIDIGAMTRAVRFEREGGAPPVGGPGNMIIRSGPGDGAAGQAPLGAEGAGFELLSGTVEQVAGSTITVKDADGAITTLELSDEVKITKQVDADRAEILAGTTILADVTRSGQLIQARTVQIMPEAPVVKELP